MSDASSPKLSDPTPPPLPAASRPAPYEPLAPIGYATGGLPEPYASARPRAKVIVWLSWAAVALQVLLVWPSVEDVLYWRSYDPAAEVDVQSERVLLGMTTADLAENVLLLALAVVFGVVTIVWFMWIYRTYRNLPALGAAGLRYSPGWAVGYYFIPILNLFRPYQVMQETWKASDVRYDAETNWQSLSVPALLGWWWAVHLVSTVVGPGMILGLGLGLGSEDPAAQLKVAWVALVISAFDITLLLVEIRLVRALTDLQERRADAIGVPLHVAPAGAWNT